MTPFADGIAACTAVAMPNAAPATPRATSSPSKRFCFLMHYLPQQRVGRRCLAVRLYTTWLLTFLRRHDLVTSRSSQIGTSSTKVGHCREQVAGSPHGRGAGNVGSALVAVTSDRGLQLGLVHLRAALDVKPSRLPVELLLGRLRGRHARSPLSASRGW